MSSDMNLSDRNSETAVMSLNITTLLMGLEVFNFRETVLQDIVGYLCCVDQQGSVTRQIQARRVGTTAAYERSNGVGRIFDIFWADAADPNMIELMVLLAHRFLSIACGYVLTRRGLFQKEAAKGASEIVMNVSLPALVFSNIVPAFTPQNVTALGPLFILAFTYQLVGFLFGIIIREVFYVPRNFWQGIIIITGMSNWSNLPNAVVLTVTRQPPFNPATDPALGVSYVSIFIVSYNLIFWVGGAARSLSWDYLPGVPQGEEAELRNLSWKQKPVGSLIAKYILKESVPQPHTANDFQPGVGTPRKGKDKSEDGNIARGHGGDEASEPTQASSSRIVEVTQTISVPEPPSTHQTDPADYRHPTTTGAKLSLLDRVSGSIRAALHPVTVALLVALPISLVGRLKALFVDISDVGGPVLHGPDGRPPLAFVIDTARLLGNIAVPLALILLGASFARLRVPRPISRLPIPAMFAVALAKMVITPIFGVLLVQAMVRNGMIPREAKVEKFVGMLLSGTPAAVNQLIVASLFAPDGNVDMYSAFFLVQYVMMFFSASALTAVSLLLS